MLVKQKAQQIVFDREHTLFFKKETIEPPQQPKVLTKVTSALLVSFMHRIYCDFPRCFNIQIGAAHDKSQLRRTQTCNDTMRPFNPRL